MASSLAPQCTPLKREYDTCFNKWYAESFLKGAYEPGVSSNGNGGVGEQGKARTECDELFEKYRACVWNAIESRNLATLIADARRDTGDAFTPPTSPTPSSNSTSPSPPTTTPPTKTNRPISSSSSDAWHDSHSPINSAASTGQQSTGAPVCEGDSCEYIPKGRGR
ncbi:UPF0203-domain-containing protein [Gonapodya prolifera JEL478]|uniref:UPF0203-domain-containing protein n=1 Tax=Gonapodya prolifera (strain JEL478) TaxID=1344416 RepID=A0A139AJ78_GONPJ|nr:UPF0203-domain-containing protein [Gonapodya prolifera JEL478]|eukprot:KXS16850.1 UPF0203-domain-containing protein [Gonapodya prolifera JEL478]